MKKLFKKYAAPVLFYSGIIAIFVLGFILGANSNNTPNADNCKEEVITEAPSGDAAQEPEYTELTVTATAYCPCVKCCGKTDGITATGTQATAGRTIAVDPSVIPYGTYITIDGVTYVAEDRGGAVKGAEVDIFFDTHEEALQWGKRQVVATIAK